MFAAALGGTQIYRLIVEHSQDLIVKVLRVLEALMFTDGEDAEESFARAVVVVPDLYVREAVS